MFGGDDIFSVATTLLLLSSHTSANFVMHYQSCSFFRMDPTVTFNVCGQHYQVSRALITGNTRSKHSMLACLVAKRWSSNEDSKKKGTEKKEEGGSIFIDRNGSNFGHVLDYLRYDSVDLPATVSNDGFMRDLDCYGILVDDDCVTQEGNICFFCRRSSNERLPVRPEIKP